MSNKRLAMNNLSPTLDKPSTFLGIPRFGHAEHRHETATNSTSSHLKEGAVVTEKGMDYAVAVQLGVNDIVRYALLVPLTAA